MSQLHVSVQGQTYGPADEATIQEWIRTGSVTASDYIWIEESNQWIAIGEVPLFARSFETAVARPPPSMPETIETLSPIETKAVVESKTPPESGLDGRRIFFKLLGFLLASIALAFVVGWWTRDNPKMSFFHRSAATYYGMFITPASILLFLGFCIEAGKSSDSDEEAKFFKKIPRLMITFPGIAILLSCPGTLVLAIGGVILVALLRPLVELTLYEGMGITFATLLVSGAVATYLFLNRSKTYRRLTSAYVGLSGRLLLALLAFLMASSLMVSVFFPMAGGSGPALSPAALMGLSGMGFLFAIIMVYWGVNSFWKTPWRLDVTRDELIHVPSGYRFPGKAGRLKRGTQKTAFFDRSNIGVAYNCTDQKGTIAATLYVYPRCGDFETHLEECLDAIAAAKPAQERRDTNFKISSGQIGRHSLFVLNRDRRLMTELYLIQKDEYFIKLRATHEGYRNPDSARRQFSGLLHAFFAIDDSRRSSPASPSLDGGHTTP